MDTELWWKHCIWTVCRISVGTSAFILYAFQIKQFCLRASVFPCCKILLISHLTLFCLCNARGSWIKTLVLPCWIRWKSPSYPSFLSSLVTSSRCLGKHTVIIPSVYPSDCQQYVDLVSQRQYLSDFSSINIPGSHCFSFLCSLYEKILPLFSLPFHDFDSPRATFGFILLSHESIYRSLLSLFQVVELTLYNCSLCRHCVTHLLCTFSCSVLPIMGPELHL